MACANFPLLREALLPPLTLSAFMPLIILVGCRFRSLDFVWAFSAPDLELGLKIAMVTAAMSQRWGSSRHPIKEYRDVGVFFHIIRLLKI